MAADLGLVPLKKLTGMATDLAKERWSLCMGLDEDIKKLKEDLEFIQTVLSNADENQLTAKGLLDLKHLAYDAEDVLDEFATEAAVRPIKEGITMSWLGEKRFRALVLVRDFLLSCCTSSSNPLFSRLELSDRLAAVRSSLEELKKKQAELQLFVSLPTGGGGGRKPLPHNINQRPEDGPISVAHFELIGREEVLQKLLRRVWGSCDEPESSSGGRNVSVIPITGMGGSGKTALAQVIYNHRSLATDDHFTYKKWLSVGDNFDVESLIGKLIKEADPGLDIEELQTKLVDKMKDRRFLIVLDDVCNLSRMAWENLWIPLSHGKKGSIVLMTSRDRTVAQEIVHDTPSHLEPLSTEECFEIFEKHAFVDGDQFHGYTTLKAIGKEIVKKLKGLPLAAKVVGCTLGGNVKVEEWKTFLKHELWTEREKDDGIMSVLEWSYTRLPAHLKPYFLYCAIFPKDHCFDKEDLILQWMAAGLVQSKGSMRLEDIGSKYFDDLFFKSFFETTNGEYVMHDLIHDLAVLVSRGECMIVSKKEPYGNIRHLSFAYNEERNYIGLSGCGKLRTILDMCNYIDKSVVDGGVQNNVFSGLKCLRVLDLSDSCIEVLPDGIGELKLLRYLDLRRCYKLRSLPESLCDLHNLQTLRIDCIGRLPSGMSKLVDLRHLEADDDLVSGVAGIGKLTSLQELSEFKASKESGHQITELEGLEELRGRLCINQLENVESREEAANARMKKKVHLDVLRYEWTEGCTNCNSEEVLVALEPHGGLEELRIHRYNGIRFPDWGALVSLKSLTLGNCTELSSILPLYCLTALKELDISGCPKLTVDANNIVAASAPPQMLWSSLEWLSIDSGALLKEILHYCNLVSLKQMVISNCDDDLMSLSDPLEAAWWQRLTSLGVLWIENCRVVPMQLHYLPSLKYLNISFCSQIQSVAEHELPKSLEKLVFTSCENLCSLPTKLNCLPSLLTLAIYDCPKITSLPESGPPESLQHVYIESCGVLEEQCEKDRGRPDWPWPKITYSRGTMRKIVIKVQTENARQRSKALSNSLVLYGPR